MTISGPTFVIAGNNYDYVVSGIPIGTVFFNSYSVYPTGWVLYNESTIVAGVQTITVTAGIGTGTLIFAYGIDEETGIISAEAEFDVYSNPTTKGEEITTIAQLIGQPPGVSTVTCGDTSGCPAPNPTPCIFVLPVFADANDTTNALKNDQSDFYYQGAPGCIGITMTLQKNASNCGGCTWINKVTIPSTSQGGVFALGKAFNYGSSPDFSGNPFSDDYGNQYRGVLISWLKVLQNLGAGEYRMQVVYNYGALGTVTDYSNEVFCLSQWNCFNIDGTVRIEVLNIGVRGTRFNDRSYVDYGTGWYSQRRLTGIFYTTTSKYVKEYNQYGDDQYNVEKPVINEQQPKYKCEIAPIPGWMDYYLSTNILQADQVLFTDYNGSNRHTFIQTPVMNDGDYAPQDENFINPNAIVVLDLAFGQNSLRRRND